MISHEDVEAVDCVWAHWVQEEQWYQVTYHTYLASQREVTVIHTKC